MGRVLNRREECADYSEIAFKTWVSRFEQGIIGEILISGARMRYIFSVTSVMAISLMMLGCGQSGALQLPADQNQDKRARYLLYSNAPKQSQQPASNAERVQTQMDAAPAASAVIDTP